MLCSLALPLISAEDCPGQSSSASPNDVQKKNKKASPKPAAQIPGPKKYFAGRANCPALKMKKGVREEFPHVDQAVALLKYTLVRDELWPTGTGSIHKRVRKGALEALNDPNMKLEYSPPLVPKEHLKGKKVVAAQAVNANLIRLSAFAGKDVESLASTIMHELVHIWQFRTQGGNGSEIPAYRAEANLPKRFLKGKVAGKNFCGKKKKGKRGANIRGVKPPGDKPFGVLMVDGYIFMGNYWEIAERPTCQVGGWGLDCEAKVKDRAPIQNPLGKWFETELEAAQAFCKNAVENSYRKQPLVPSGHYFKFKFDNAEHNVVATRGWCTLCKKPGLHRPSAQCHDHPLGTLDSW